MTSNTVTVTGFIAAPSIEEAAQYMPVIDECDAVEVAFEQGWYVYTVEMVIDFSTLVNSGTRY